MSKELSFKDVIAIRRQNRNPDVTFAPNIKYKDLENKNYKEIVEIFDKKIRDWFFDLAAQLSRRKRHKSGDMFVVMIINCILIDLLSQYRYGLEHSEKTRFKEFFQNYLNKYNHNLKNPIPSCEFKYEKWKSLKINSIADAVYHGFRCGLLHSLRIHEYGRINQLFNEAIKIEPWLSDSSKIDIHINPALLLMDLKKVFRQYVRQLRKSTDKDIKNNFISKFEYDYGVKIKD